ncbi:hypothetical protein D3C78_1269620 [compost metagenome]
MPGRPPNSAVRVQMMKAPYSPISGLSWATRAKAMHSGTRAKEVVSPARTSARRRFAFMAYLRFTWDTGRRSRPQRVAGKGLRMVRNWRLPDQFADRPDRARAAGRAARIAAGALCSAGGTVTWPPRGGGGGGSCAGSCCCWRWRLWCRRRSRSVRRFVSSTTWCSAGPSTISSARSSREPRCATHGARSRATRRATTRRPTGWSPWRRRGVC